MARTQASGRIRVGVGGWLYAPWRGVFYPKGLKQADELAYAASRLTTIEINATHYRLQTPASFRKWAAAAPDGFVFSVKGPRLVTQQKVLAETGELHQALLRLRPRRAGRQARARALAIRALQDIRGRRLRAVSSTICRASSTGASSITWSRLAMRASLRRNSSSSCARRVTSIAFTDAETWPSIADLTGDVVYARLQRATMRSKPPTSPRRSTPGPSAPSCGRRAVCRKICHASLPERSPRPSRATSSSTSSTRESCARPPRPWR